MANKHVGISFDGDDKNLKATLALIAKQIKDVRDKTEEHTKAMSFGFSGVTAAVFKAGIAGDVAKKIFNELANTFKETVLGIELLTTVSEVYHAALINLINGIRDMGSAMANAMVIAAKMNLLRQDERIETIKQSKAQFEYNKLVFDAADKGKTLTERIELWTAALKKNNEMVDLGVTHTKEQLNIVQLKIKNSGATNKLLDEEAKLIAHLYELESERFSGTKRIQSQLTGAIEKDHADKMKAWFDEIEEMNKVSDAQQKLLDQTKKVIYAPPTERGTGNLSRKMMANLVLGSKDANSMHQASGLPAIIDHAAESMAVMDTAVRALNDGFTELFTNAGGGFKNMIKSMISSLEMYIAKLAIAWGISEILGLIAPGSQIAVAAFTNFSKVRGFAGGTNFAPGGLSMVGERGPELVNLPRGSQVIPNNKLSNRLYGKIKLSGKDAYILVSNYAEYLNVNT